MHLAVERMDQQLIMRCQSLWAYLWKYGGPSSVLDGAIPDASDEKDVTIPRVHLDSMYARQQMIF